MTENQIEVLQWWYDSRDYVIGLELFSRFSKNKVLVHVLKNKAEQFGRSKLEYELLKVVGLDFRNMPAFPKEIHPDLNTVIQKTETIYIQPKPQITFPGWFKSLFKK